MGIESVIKDLVYVLEHAPGDLVYRYSDEPDPRTLDFVFRPEARVTEAQPEVQKKAVTAVKTNLPANFLCHLCENRMFPVRKYYHKGTKPVLVLHFSGAITGDEIVPDRSNRHILGSEEQDALFQRICSVSGWTVDEFHFQELPACYFNPSSGSPLEWETRVRNCLVHVKKTIQLHDIRLLIFTGPAAPLFYGKKGALEKTETMKIEPVNIDGLQIPAFAMRSPAALLALEQKRKAAKTDEERSSLIQEEKEIKNRILQSFQNARRYLSL